MTDTVLSFADRFQPGTVVRAYDAIRARIALRQGGSLRNLAAVETAITADDGTVTFTTLTAGKQYVVEADAGADVATTTPGGGGDDQVDVVTIEASSGTFTITVAGNETAGIAYNAAAAAVQSALEAASGIAPGDVAVTGAAGGPWTLTWGGLLADTALVVSADGTGLTGGVARTVTVTGAGTVTTGLAGVALPSWRQRRRDLGLV